MITTTIGGGFAHLYPSTVAGRIFTMIYAFFGIPLVLTILDDLGNYNVIDYNSISYGNYS